MRRSVNFRDGQWCCPGAWLWLRRASPTRADWSAKLAAAATRRRAAAQAVAAVVRRQVVPVRPVQTLPETARPRAGARRMAAPRARTAAAVRRRTAAGVAVRAVAALAAPA